MDTKTPEQAQMYLDVFKQRYHESEECKAMVAEADEKLLKGKERMQRELEAEKMNQQLKEIRLAQIDDFSAQNLETIQKYDAKYKAYTLMLQNSASFDHGYYRSILEAAHQKQLLLRQVQGDGPPPDASRAGLRPETYRRSLETRLNHLQRSRPQGLDTEMVKYAATALRAEDTLRKHR